MERLNGKVVLVTGANSGIGFEIAQACVAAEAGRVIVAGRRKDAVDEAVAKLGSRAVGELVDQSSLASIDEFVARVSRAYPVIDVLFDNAGIAHGALPTRITG